MEFDCLDVALKAQVASGNSTNSYNEAFDKCVSSYC